jgi:parallel beta-helix repeat protein
MRNRQIRRAAERNLRKQARKMASSTSGAALALGVGLALSSTAQGATFTATNLNDSGPGSLRQAVLDANANSGADVISFQAGLSGTIALAGPLVVYDDVDLQGPGADLLTVSGNDVTRVFDLAGDTTISGLTIAHGRAVSGAGILINDVSVDLQNVVLSANDAQNGEGGGLRGDGFNMQLTISDCKVTGNSAANGGGIYVEDTAAALLLIENTVISGNTASGNGGGIYFYDPDNSVLIDRCTISGNTAGRNGGGIYLYDTDGSSVNGFGLLVQNTTISGNSATGYGGGVFLYGPDDPVKFENTTISGNTAEYGGGAYFYDGGYGGTGIVLNFCTVAGNTATLGGGGLYAGENGVELDNTIVADNIDSSGYPELAGDGQFAVSNSLVEGDYYSISDLGGNIFGEDPQLGPLMDNGGVTETKLPAETSPVVNSADPLFVGPPYEDQRGAGYARITNGRADMGAVEVGSGPSGIVLNDFNADGKSDLAIFYPLTGGWFGRAVSGETLVPGVRWGYKGVKTVPGDFNGDGASDLSVYDLKTGKWYIYATESKNKGMPMGILANGLQWGFAGAIPVVGDYDGDNISDPAVYNPGNGTWYIRTMEGAALQFGTQWGYKGANPVTGDYNGDGAADLTVYDAQTGMWYIRFNLNKAAVSDKMPLQVATISQQWGFKGSTAVPGDYNGDGRADLAVYSRYDGRWYILSLGGSSVPKNIPGPRVLAYQRNWGFTGAIPVPGDFNGDGTSDLAVYNPADGKWYIQSMDGTVLLWGQNWGGFKGAELVLP